MKLVIAFWLALYVLGVAYAAAGAVNCVTSGHTGEGFPAVSCSDGKTYYQDMDGDGRDPSTVGRWIQTEAEWVR